MAHQDSQYTADTLFNGAMSCRQHKTGYRFSLDALLAAHFSPPAKGAKILDLGAGCGIIGLILLYRWNTRIGGVTGLEIQPALKSLAEQNFYQNGFADKGRCLLGDVKNILDVLEPESFDQVICNPPFYHSDCGRQSLAEEARIARHQIAATIEHFTQGASAVVKNGGIVVFVYPANQMLELLMALKGSRLEPKILRFVYNDPGHPADARLLLIQCRKNGGPGVRIQPPLYVYQKRDGTYSQEMEQLYTPNPDT